MIEPSMNRSLPWFMSYLWHGVYPVGSARVVIEPLLTFTKRHTQRPYQNWRVLFPCLSTSAFIQTLTVISQPNLICHLSLGAEQPKAGSGWVERNSESYRWSYCKVVFNWWAHQGFTMDPVYPIGLFSLPPGMIIPPAAPLQSECQGDRRIHWQEKVFEFYLHSLSDLAK